MNLRGKSLFILTVVIIFTFCLLIVAYGNSVMQTVNAYTGVKIIYNNRELVGEKPPYIINDTAYIPLRLLMESFDKNISYEQASNSVIIADKDGSVVNDRINELNNTVSLLKAQLDKLQSESSELATLNSALETENRALTLKVAALDSKITALAEADDELKEIEYMLQETYEEAGDEYLNDEEIFIFITLNGDEKEVELEIYLDLTNSEKVQMTDIPYSRARKLLKEIYDDLADKLDKMADYSKVRIKGFMEDDEDNILEYNGKAFYPSSWK